MKYAVVTGASSGIGKEFAKQLDEQGYALVLVARRKERLIALQKELKHPSILLVLDLSQKESCFKLIQEIEDLEVEVFINNAGLGYMGRFEETNLEKELEMIHVNIEAMHILTKLMVQRMQDGYFLNVASSAGLIVAGPYHACYYASKSYITSLTRAIVLELKESHRHLYVGQLCPGPVKTEFDQKAGVNHALKAIEASSCVKYALKKMKQKQTVIIPTFSLKLAIFLQRLIPASLYIRFVSYQQKKKLKIN